MVSHFGDRRLRARTKMVARYPSMALNFVRAMGMAFHDCHFCAPVHHANDVSRFDRAVVDVDVVLGADDVIATKLFGGRRNAPIIADAPLLLLLEVQSNRRDQKDVTVPLMSSVV
jgi:hypothetical protein